MVDGTAAGAKPAAPNGKPTQLETLRPIFERLVGRTPTADDNKEMLALVDLVKKTDAGFVLVSYMAETRARESREKVPAEVRAIVGEAEAKIRTATTDFERSLSKSVDAMLGAISDRHTAGPRPSQWRWPKQVAAVAAALVIMGALSFSGAVAQRAADSAVCRSLATAPRALLHVPWLSMAVATVSGWSALPFVGALAIALVIIAVLGFRKSGPVSRQLWP